MKTTPGNLVARGLLLRCPNCGRGRLFRSAFRLHDACPECGLVLERGDGFYLGAMSLNYGTTILAWLVPVALLWLSGLVPGAVAAWACGIGAVVFPVAFYRHSRGLWFAAYYCFLPAELPCNAPAGADRGAAGRRP